METTTMMLLHEMSGNCALELKARPHTTIGRSAGCDLVIAEPSVSRVHASIDALEGQYVLQDIASANGTFLNGVRLVPRHSFSLREGDVIEIGTARLVYGRNVAGGEEHSFPLGDQRVDRTYPVATLIRDGCVPFGGENGAAFQASLARAVAGAEKGACAAACLALLLAELHVEGASLYLGHVQRRLELIESLPGGREGASSMALALRAWTERTARHSERSLAGDAAISDDTCVIPLRSSFAVPFYRRDLGCVIVIERIAGRRFEHRDLVHATVLAERIARSVCIGATNQAETPFGYD